MEIEICGGSLCSRNYVLNEFNNYFVNIVVVVKLIY